MEITPELKDRVLNELLDASNGGQVMLETFERNMFLDLSDDMLEMLLNYFADNKLINLNGGIGFFMVQPRVEAHDLKSRGGFVGQEILFRQNIDKLLMEIESLKHSAPDTFEKITSIAANLITFLSAIN